MQLEATNATIDKYYTTDIAAILDVSWAIHIIVKFFFPVSIGSNNLCDFHRPSL